MEEDVNLALNKTVRSSLALYIKSSLGGSDETFRECKKSPIFYDNFDMYKAAKAGLRDYLDNHDKALPYSHEERMNIETLSIELGQTFRYMRDEVALKENARKRKVPDNVIIHSQSLRIKVRELSELDFDLVKKFRDELRILAQQSTAYSTNDRQAYITDRVKIGITMILHTRQMIATPEVAVWESWSDATLFPILLDDLTPIRLNQTDDERLETNIGSIRIHIDWKNLNTTLMSAHFAGIEAFREAKLLNENQLDVLATVQPLKFAKALWELVLTNFENRGTPSRYQLYFELVASAVRRDQTFLKGCSWSASVYSKTNCLHFRETCYSMKNTVSLPQTNRQIKQLNQPMITIITATTTNPQVVRLLAEGAGKLMEGNGLNVISKIIQTLTRAVHGNPLISVDFINH